jgi:type VI secretion system secreted protein VgrG
VSITAQSDDIELIANKVLTLISQSDWVDIRGKKGVRLHGGNHMLEIGEKVQFFTSSPVLFHGNLETLAPKSTPQKEDPIRSEPTPEQLHYTLQSHANSGRPHASVPYTLFKGNTKVEDGLTDEFGRITIEHADGTPDYKVKLANGEEFALKVHSRFAGSDHVDHHEQLQSSQGKRALNDTPAGRKHG